MQRPPTSFLEKCQNIPCRPNFVLSNGEKCVGRFSAIDRSMKDLRNLCKLCGVSRLNYFSVVLFTYDGGENFNVHMFNEKMVEIMTVVEGKDIPNFLEFFSFVWKC